MIFHRMPSLGAKRLVIMKTIPMVVAILPVMELSHTNAAVTPTVHDMKAMIRLKKIIWCIRFVRRNAEAGGAIMNAITNKAPIELNAATAVREAIPIMR